jgi:NAD-dependent dihydropyrimidine dehydrogenase PreA subunit
MTAETTAKIAKSAKPETPEKKTWHGIPREAIPWLPTVDADACIGCQLCYITCGRAVYEMRDGVAVAVAAMECVVGCSTCGNVCPTGAITFPNLDSVWKIEREHQIFRTVKKEALRKHEREDALKARQLAQEAVAQVSTRAKVEVAGEFGDKHFLVRIEELIEGKPFDIVNLRLEVPTVKGARQKAPSFMSFEVTSEQQADIAPFLDEVKKLVHDAGLVLVSATPVA